MVDLGQVKWRKLLGFAIVVIVAAIVGYVLPSPMWANSPGRVLVRVAIIAAGFGILPVVYRIWSPSGRGRISTRRWVVLFALLVVMLLALGLLGPKLFSWLWGEPLRWHNFFGHSFRFRKGVLASPSRRRGLGKGAAFESLSPAAL